jgi:hypothetical protein
MFNLNLENPEMITEKQIKVVKTNSYTEDTFRRLELDGRCVHGIYKQYSPYYRRSMWMSDTYSIAFKTIKEAKAWTVEKLNTDGERIGT